MKVKEEAADDDLSLSSRFCFDADVTLSLASPSVNTSFLSAEPVSSSDKLFSPAVLGLEGNFDITLCLSTFVSGIIDNLDLLEASLLEEVIPLEEPPRYPELPPKIRIMSTNLFRNCVLT